MGYFVCLKSYTVQYGDSIGRILKNEGLPKEPFGGLAYNRLWAPMALKINGLESDKLEAGQTIDVPFVPVGEFSLVR